jgi:predicted MPP superfamily phosphohydrolase
MGLFNKQGTTMYVNRGIGTTILPIRFFCSPEITIFRFTEKHKDSIHGDVKTNEM